MPRRTGRIIALAALLLPALAAAADLKVGGYAKLDLIWTDKITSGGGNGVGEVAGGASSVPLDGDAAAQHAVTDVNARQSRLNVTGTGDVEGVKVKGFVEADFHSSTGNTYVTNSRLFRMRQAYVQATLPSGLFVLGGQTWSTFMDIETFYDTIDFNGPAGELFARQPQLRVGYRTGDLTLAVAAEQSSVLGLDAAQQPQSQPLPLLAAKAVWSPTFVTVVAAAAWAENRAVLPAGQTSKDAWGVQAGLALPVPGTPFTLKGNVNHLAGLNRIANGDFSDAFLVGSRLQNVVTTGFYVGGNLAVTSSTTLNAFYGHRAADRSVASTGEDKVQQSVHVNVMQKLWGPTEAGLEYQYAARQQFDGSKGSANRVQGAFFYYF